MLCLQVETVADYDLYCHYVAGLVGVGLSQLFGKYSARTSNSFRWLGCLVVWSRQHSSLQYIVLSSYDCFANIHHLLIATTSCWVRVTCLWHCIAVAVAPPAASSGLESAQFARAEVLSNHMGLFLQKTNIIRDYLVRRCAGVVCDTGLRP